MDTTPDTAGPAGPARSADLAGFAGKVVLITGGGGGIGSAAARRFTAQGGHVVLADIDRARGEAVARETGALFVRADTAELADNERLVRAAVDRFGGLDAVWLNSGVLAGSAIGDGFDPEAYRRLLAVNVDSVVYGVQAALPALRARGGGSITVTASTTGLRPSPDVFYAASKHAVVGLVRSLAPALAGDGVTLNVLCPGAVETPLIAGRLAAWRAAGVAVAAPDLVVDAMAVAVRDGRTGQAWVVAADTGITRFEFADLVVAGEGRLRFADGRVTSTTAGPHDGGGHDAPGDAPGARPGDPAAAPAAPPAPGR
ncbi:SDR family NAD(P)-dependent oxidoreductase [Kitasatospora sp. NPDC086009]|uniref:SDR family NAD(P)-dependent oxidoreductase n=1 Tax=unclassified Kitasatospora TaxID=2633591 RepID=UPI0037C84CFE